MKLLFLLSSILVCTPSVFPQNRSDREAENLIGPVRLVRLEKAVVRCKWWECTESRAKGGLNTYDLKGSLVSSTATCYDPDNPEHRLRRYPFGDGPAVIRKEEVGADGAITGTTLYFFNTPGRQSERITSRPDGSLEERIIFTFDLNGRFAEVTHYHSEMQVFARTIYAYDDRGNEIEVTTDEQNGAGRQIVLSEYEFDQIGNWIKRIMTIKRLEKGDLRVVATLVFFRTITYH
jgi:hypothetical protein